MASRTRACSWCVSRAPGVSWLLRSVGLANSYLVVHSRSYRAPSRLRRDRASLLRVEEPNGLSPLALHRPFSPTFRRVLGQSIPL